MRFGASIVAVLCVSALAGCIQNEPVPFEPEPQAIQEAPSDPQPAPEEPPAASGDTPSTSPEPAAPEANESEDPPSLLEPHVVVAVPDSGINPYHEVFYRPNRTTHPCTYIEDYPCDVPALNLSVGKHDSYRDAVLADLELWESFEPGDWYWIPGTAIVAIGCDNPHEGEPHTDGIPIQLCGLDEVGNHGTGVASSVISENPDALLVVYESFELGHTGLDSSGVPIDIYTHSAGFNGPTPYVGPTGPMLEPFNSITVRAAGNRPDTTLDKYPKARPDVIAVGGAYPAGDSVPATTAKNMDVASYYERPGARSDSITEYRPDFPGTSFSAPTVAGALSKVVLGIRQASGYTGSIHSGMVDPLADVSYKDLRDALNATASYRVEAKYPNVGPNPVPVNHDAPWLQLGWGIYDGNVADATLDVLLGRAPLPEKPEDAREYQEAQYEVRTVLYG